MTVTNTLSMVLALEPRALTSSLGLFLHHNPELGTAPCSVFFFFLDP